MPAVSIHIFGTGTPYGALCFEGDDALVEGVVYEK